MSNKQNEKFVYGWYHYADGTDKKFRYSASKENDLRQNGKKVTVEITFGGGKWEKRRGIVSWDGGNFTVTPA